MSDYIDYAVQTNPDALATEAFDYLQAAIPGWAPNAGNLEVILVESMARMVAEARDVASAVPRSIFRYFGNSVMGIAPTDDTAALGNTTWVARDNAGYTIPVGTQIGMRAAGDELVAFKTSFEVVIPPGSTSTAAGAVSVSAAVPGSLGSGLGGVAELIDSLDWVSTITMVGVTTGGEDAETDDEYLNRLAAQLTLLSRVPILPADFALFALNQPGVGRALAIDGYNPSNGSLNNERMVSVVVTDINGEPLSNINKTAVLLAIDAVREVNFIATVIDPTYTIIDVSTSFVPNPSSDPDTVRQNVEDAIEAYLSPANWGTKVFVDNPDNTWYNTSVVQIYELVTIVNNVAGVDRVVTIGAAISGGTIAASDISLPGVAPMTRPGSIQAVNV
jgi:uncharacterized phage protein gp47/JayE